jgi:hypothetical protein
MNVDHEHDLGLENLLDKELSTFSVLVADTNLYMHKLNECFHSEDLYQTIIERVSDQLV